MGNTSDAILSYKDEYILKTSLKKSSFLQHLLNEKNDLSYEKCCTHAKFQQKYGFRQTPEHLLNNYIKNIRESEELKNFPSLREQTMNKVINIFKQKWIYIGYN